MRKTTATSTPATETASPANPPCPKCGEPLFRIPRTLLGRVISLLVPVRRYRCESPLCHWVGHVRGGSRRER